uniref:Uncharacterized protein n=1 Tax=Oncorhynchus tshawytscha TaxID=74940 RepID=A0AAZ3RC86_ONCTS
MGHGVRKSPKLRSDTNYITTSCLGGLSDVSWVRKSPKLRSDTNYITTNSSAYNLPNVTGTFNGNERVLWSDETKIELFRNKHQRWLWHGQKDSYAEKYLIPTMKYGGGSLMLWGCFSFKGPGQLVTIHGIIDSIKYQQILHQKMTAFARK